MTLDQQYRAGLDAALKAAPDSVYRTVPGTILAAGVRALALAVADGNVAATRLALSLVKIPWEAPPGEQTAIEPDWEWQDGSWREPYADPDPDIDMDAELEAELDADLAMAGEEEAAGTAAPAWEPARKGRDFPWCREKSREKAASRMARMHARTEFLRADLVSRLKRAAEAHREEEERLAAEAANGGPVPP